MPTFRAPLLTCFLALANLSTAAPASKPLTPAEARNHIGEAATVCGKVASTHYVAQTRGQPTYLNLDKPYPNSPFTVVILGLGPEQVDAPETAYQDHGICVTGQVKEYRNAPEIVASDPKQIRTQDAQSH